VSSGVGQLGRPGAIERARGGRVIHVVGQTTHRHPGGALARAFRADLPSRSRS
jgi:hypothetical protein